MKIKYFAWLKNITDHEEEIICDKLIKDVNALKNYLSKKYPSLKKYFDDDIIRIAINLVHITTNKKLNKNDEIAFFPPVSGG